MRPKSLGKGDPPSITGDPQDMGLNERSGIDHTQKLRGENSIEGQRPTIKKGSISSDRGTFKTK